jgi:hypothetical protein
MAGRCRPNRALIAAREAKGYSRNQLAARVRAAGRELGLPAPELDAIGKQLYRLERGVTTRPGGDFYLPALCSALGLSAAELFAEHVPAAPTDDAGLVITSHKFIPVYVGAEAAAAIGADESCEASTCEWLPSRRATIPLDLGPCTLTVFEFGVVVAHLVEEQRFDSLAELAVWRRQSYPVAREQVFEQLRARWPSIVEPPHYVLSAYWLSEPHWSGDDLETALRILCAPSALLARKDGQSLDDMLVAAEVAERACFRDGFHHPEIKQFGVAGASIGHASWAGVSYLPLAPDRALTPDELVTFETVVQALWCYTNMIAAVVEDGDDPVVPDQYSWRFLRACHSRLTSARPRETGQHRMMKDAILATSRLPGQLLDAHAVLRDLDHLVGRR